MNVPNFVRIFNWFGYIRGRKFSMFCNSARTTVRFFLYKNLMCSSLFSRAVESVFDSHLFFQLSQLESLEFIPKFLQFIKKNRTFWQQEFDYANVSVVLCELFKTFFFIFQTAAQQHLTPVFRTVRITLSRGHNLA